MATGMVRIGAFDFYPDGPLGCTVGYNGAHGTDIHLFQEMIAYGAVRVRLNIKPDLYAATSMSANPSTWNWGFVDAVVLMANQNNIHVTLIARGFTPSNNTTFASWQENSSCASGYTQTTIAGYTKIAVALARRYSGDGNPDNAKDSAGRALQADGIEIGNEEINSMQDTSSLPYTGCRKAMRYVKLVRDTLAQLRAPSTSGGGGWVPRGNFPARVGAWGIVHDQPNEITSTYGLLTHPVLDATYNPTANSSSIFGFDGTLNLQMLDYANFHNYNPADGTGGLTPANETKQIRGILNGVGNTNIPIWCTEAGWDGPCNNVSETVQANYYAANDDGSGGGALQALKDAECQHWDIFTINYWGGSINGAYVGQAMSIATKTSATGTPPNTYVHFLARTRIGNFMTSVDKGAWAAKPAPAGFGGGPPPPPPPSGPLPGQTFTNGVSNYIFGTNMAADFTTHTVRNTPAIQAWIKQANFQVMRCNIPVGSANSYIDSVITASAACGCVPFVILSSQAVNASWNSSLVTYLGSKCNLYEFGNEPDLNGISESTYATQWNAQIPTLRGLNTRAAFIGPALGVFSNLNSYLVPWLTSAVAAGNTPDGVSYHVYPCTDPACDQTCCTPKSGNFASDAATVKTAVAGVTSAKIALCLTEWNLDATNPPKSYTQGTSFNSTWTKAAIDSMVAGGLDMACQWDAGSNAGGGLDDLVSTTSPYNTQVQYAPLVDRITFYLGGSGTPPPPPPAGGSLSGSFTALASTNVNLTTEGTGDWAHWGVTDATSFDHKSTGGSQISNFTTMGTGLAVRNPSALNSFTHTDGTPNVSETATTTGVKITPPLGGSGSGVPHVMVVALENHSYNNTSAKYVVGNSNFPHINGFMSTYGYCTKFYGISHPSLPNYLGFASGSDYGIANDSYNPASAPLAGNTLADSLDKASIGWKHYAESLPSAGYLGGDSGAYVQHHNPWVYFKTFRSAGTTYQQAHLVSLNASPTFTNLIADLNGGSPPAFVYVQPNNSNNGHSGTDTACDNYVNNLVSAVQGTSWYASGGIIMLWWDESNPDTDTAGIGDKGSNGAGGGHTNCIVISAANSGATLTSNLNHYGVLRAIEKLYGLPYLGKSNNTIDGDLTPLLGTTVGAVLTNNLGNGFKITAPADTNPRTLNIYTDANQGIASLAASLSDGSCPDFYDSTLKDSSGGMASAGVYTLVYNAASSGKTLTVAYTLSDNNTPGTSSGSDIFTRANQSNLGTSSDGQTYQLVQEVGTPAWSIASNQAKLTSSNAGDTGVALLGSHMLADCEAVAIVNLSNTADSAGLVLRTTSSAGSYYRASLSGSTILLAYVTGGVSTTLNSQPATLKTATNYWLRFRICKSSLYAKYWPNDGSREPTAWNVFVTNTTLVAAGQFGMRGVIGAASDSILFDTLSVVDLSATGDPSYVSLYAADLPTSITTASGALSATTSTPTGTIDLTAEGAADWAHWGLGSATAFDHKANVTSQISNFTQVGGGTYSQDSAALLIYTWTADGTPDVSATTPTGTSVQGVANGFSFTVPADTTSRTINVYVQATKAQGQLTATLSDGSATAYTDSSLNDSGTGAVKKYAITYNAASANQTLTVKWVMLADNGGSGSTTTYSADTFTRANNASSWGTASGGETYAHTIISGAGTPTESISSNKGQITSTGTNVLFSRLGTQSQANAETLVRWSVSNVAADTVSLVLRETATNNYYRCGVSGGTTFKFAHTLSGTDTDITTTPFTYVANTLYWMRFRLSGSNLYGRIWADGSTEPTGWTLTATDSSIAGSGGWGLRTKVTAGDTAKYDSYTVTSIPSGGTPGSIELQAVDTASGASTGGGPPPPHPPPGSLLVQVNQADALATSFLGIGIEQDAYIAFASATAFPLTFILYGSAVADATLTTACDMTMATGGTETSAQTIMTGANDWAEIWSQGNAGLAGVAAIPATPTGHGWVYQPGAGTFATGNWSVSAKFHFPGLATGTQNLTLRCWKYTAGVYTSIGNFPAATVVSNATTIYSFGPTSFSTVSFGSSDWLCFDLYLFDSTGVGGDNPTVYESTSATTGVANDMQITTALFSPVLTTTERNLINTRLNYMTPSIIRTAADDCTWWCPSGVVGTYNFSTVLMQEWYAVFDNAQAQGYTVIVGVNSPAPFTLLSTSWCTVFADLIDYLVNTLGYTCIQYVSGLSELDLL